jgi:ATP/maltotriose-dependent transcriptional regulator MalT
MLSLKNNTTLSTLCNERIFQLFQKAGRNEIMVSEKDWTELQNLMERKLPDSMNQLSRLSQGFNLSQQEFRICCLIKLGFINQAISNILLVSKSAISRSQSRMYGKLTGEKENASKMRLFIEDL